MKAAQFILGVLILIGIEVAKVYFIMPFPGSQRSESIGFAYFLHGNIIYLRIIGWLMIIYPVIYYIKFGHLKARILVILPLIIYGVIVYFFNFEFLADKMFYQPGTKIFSPVSDSKVSRENLVLGVVVNQEAKAYPIQFIGYHHQVRDSIGGEPVMITYCTVCRTGRAFKPFVGDKPENFRLVGMDHFNAMFEDETTGSWWRQVSGEAIAGPLRGQHLPEIMSEQMTLDAWIREHPDTKIMQPDTMFNAEYTAMKKYDKGGGGKLTGRDSLSWKDKSWVVGIQIGALSRAYDWNDLVDKRVINDTLSNTPIAVVLENDSASFHVYKRGLFEFQYDTARMILTDLATQSVWDWNGVCKEGSLTGTRLPVVQSYQEFWHSWSLFRPATTAYKSPLDK